MKIIEPKAELWDQSEGETWQQHVARCARVCYGHEGKTDNAEKFVDGLRKRGHNSMLRHATRYFVVDASMSYLKEWGHCPYVTVSSDMDNGWALLSANRQFTEENVDIPFVAKHEGEVSDTQVLDMAKQWPEIFYVYRLTFCLTTQISTSRELNRVSPNNIAERSTRYCSSEEELEICKPWWFPDLYSGKEIEYGLESRARAADNAWYSAGSFYRRMLEFGAKPEDARGVLPLDTATKVVYTYTVAEWMNIIDNRYYEKTGRAHPNAKLIIGMVRDEINTFAQFHNIDCQI